MLSLMDMSDKHLARRGLKQTTLYVPEALHRQAKIYAARHNTTVTALLLEGLRARLKERTVEVDAGD
jgi:hypothetical protein